MAFKFIVKDEDLPKPTILSITHVISIFLGMAAFTGRNNLHPNTMVVFVISEFIQIIYMFAFYKKIVWERYANTKLKTVTISFITTNVFLGIVSLLELKYGAFFSLVPLIISLLLVFFTTLQITIYLRKINFLSRAKTWFILLKEFSFPFYKFTGIIPMFFLLPSILIKSKIYLGISLALLVIGMAYTGLGEYFYTKRKDELDRLIKYEASFFAMQLLPAIFIPLFFVETFWKIQVPWFYAIILFSVVHTLVQTIINRKYE